MKPPKSKEDDRITIRDLALKLRMEAVIKASGDKVNMTDIVRAALEEKLDETEVNGYFSTKVSLAVRSNPPNALGAIPQPEAKVKASQPLPKGERKTLAG